MAKILVADDNSNVQKTVTLALVELGVEVVAVNNGDAAVRKLADFCPDLVLADIFMPVRNGYEVCEYVKKDSRFSQVPVVLLVGAFDPLDEREAQRVGADGILKKPFVPPDPLITMVKTLLDRSLGERLVAVTASKPAVSVQAKAGGAPTAEKRPPVLEVPVAQEETPEEELRPAVGRVSFGEGEHPIAFGQLLDSPAKDFAAPESEIIEPVDDAQILTSVRDASLGDPIFWKTEEPAPEPGEENSEAEEDVSSGLPMNPWKLDEEELPRRSEADLLPPVEPFELVRDENGVGAGQISTIVESSSLIVQDPASQASLTVEAGKPQDLAANPIEWMASVPPPTSEEIPVPDPEWSAAFKEAQGAKSESPAVTGTDAGKKESEPLAAAPDAVSVSTPEPPPFRVPAELEAKLPAQNAAEPAQDAAKNAWSVLTASFQSKFAEPAAEKQNLPGLPITETPATLDITSGISESSNSEEFASKLPTQSPEDTAHSIAMRDWSDLTAGLQPKIAEPPAEINEHSLEAVPPSPAAPTTDALSLSSNSMPTLSTALPQTPEDTAHSLAKRDWTDLASGLQSESVEPVSEKHDHPAVLNPEPPAAAATNAESPSSVSASPVPTPSTQGTEDTPTSALKRDWSDLVGSFQSKPIAPLAEKVATPSTVPGEGPAAGNAADVQPAPASSAPIVSKPSTQSPEDTASSLPKHDWADLAASLKPKPVAPVADKPRPGFLAHPPAALGANAQPPAAPVSNPNKSASTLDAQIPGANAANTVATPVNSTSPGQPDPALVEAVVQRVLEKMRPQVVDIITKEFLRPVVQALVHREITKR